MSICYPNSEGKGIFGQNLSARLGESQALTVFCKMSTKSKTSSIVDMNNVKVMPLIQIKVSKTGHTVSMCSSCGNSYGHTTYIKCHIFRLLQPNYFYFRSLRLFLEVSWDEAGWCESRTFSRINVLFHKSGVHFYDFSSGDLCFRECGPNFLVIKL